MIRGYYFITDSSLSKAGNISDARNAVSAGVTVIQYRNKTGSTLEMYEEAAAIRRIASGRCSFLINDRIDIALAVNADGIHIGQDDMPYAAARKLLGKKKIIGVTVHNAAEAADAQYAGADYIGVSPIFATSTKQDAGRPAGIELIREIKKLVKIPVIAIGGINLDNATDVVAAGADGLCAISAVVAGGNVREEIKKFQRLFAG
jgi:thiamine-phosphate pyrophosphorylase